MQSAMRLRLRTTRTSTTLHHKRISPNRELSTKSSHQAYSATLPNLRIGSATRVIFQGFTGRQATANAKESIEWGTNIVGGVTPGRDGEHLGLPVLPTVRRAVAELKPDATGIYVPAPLAPVAIEEAIEAEVPLIVAVAEHVPLHDMLRIHNILRTQSKSRLVGPNSPGIISAAEGERCRIGFQPLPCFSAGCVGIAAKSGTLSYEAVAATTRAGLGQSLCIGVGGDIVPGTDLVEALQVLEADPNTKAIALIGEVGGDGEVLAAQWVKDYHKRTPQAERKPIVAVVAGKRLSSYKVMGHAGAFWLPGEPDANQKIDALRDVGVTIVSHPAKIGTALRELLEQQAREFKKMPEGARYASRDDFASEALGLGNLPHQQTRGISTSARTNYPTRTRPTTSALPSSLQPNKPQSRGLHLKQEASMRLLYEERRDDHLRLAKFPVIYIALSIDRAARAQCITTGLIYKQMDFRSPSLFHKILLPPGASTILDLGPDEWNNVLEMLAEHFLLSKQEASPSNMKALTTVLRNMGTIFRQKEAKLVSIQFSWVISPMRPFLVHDMRIELDDAACRSGGRLQDFHEHWSAAAAAAREPGAVEAEKHGIIYHKLRTEGSGPFRRRNIGTLVNGAGLAMNTVDALWDAGGAPANFLDTGGQATPETIKKSFEIILRDNMVKVIFVNIFGGLTLGDMIARGIILAFQELNIKVPVVVRIRGTNEKEGQQIIADSGLPLFAFDDFEEAAAKTIQLANEAELKKGRQEVSGSDAAITDAAITDAATDGEDKQRHAVTEVTVHQATDNVAPEEGHQEVNGSEAANTDAAADGEGKGEQTEDELTVHQATDDLVPESHQEVNGSEAANTDTATDGEESKRKQTEDEITVHQATDDLAPEGHQEVNGLKAAITDIAMDGEEGKGEQTEDEMTVHQATDDLAPEEVARRGEPTKAEP